MFVEDRRGGPGIPLSMLLPGNVFFRDGDTRESSYCMKIEEITRKDGRPANVIRLGNGKMLFLPDTRKVIPLAGRFVVDAVGLRNDEETEAHLEKLRADPKKYRETLKSVLADLEAYLLERGEHLDLLLAPWVREARQCIEEESHAAENGH